MAENMIKPPVAADGWRVYVGDKLYTDWSRKCYQVCAIELRQCDTWAVLDGDGGILNLEALYHTPPYVAENVAEDLFNLIDIAITQGQEVARKRADSLVTKIVDNWYVPKPN